MAEAIVFLAIERIADLLIHEALFLNDVRQEVESLKAELERMKSFLKDVDRKQEQDERLRTRVLSPSRKERKLIDKLKEDELVEKLYDVLKEKRYLVVLDDIWSYKDWDSLRPAFPKGKEGSKLLLTTRKKKVALLVDPCSSPVELPLLTDDESWKLFKRKAFSENKMEAHACSKEFEMLGKEMLKKCGGLPLAIVVLGGLLATKKSWNEWEMVQKNINAYLNKDQRQEYGGVTEILALSYNELPFHLKPCFLYLGHYPEDLEISKKELVRLWIAEGFISPSLGGGEMLMEDVAEQYLEELTNRCLVQVGRRNHTGASVKTCYIHDLLRDLCVSKAREENFFGIVQPSMNGNENCSLDLTVAAVSKMRRIVVHPSKRGTKMSCSANGFPQLDSLHIYSLDLKEWQMEVGAMPCLRSLHLTCVPRMKMFPEGLRSEESMAEFYEQSALKCDLDINLLQDNATVIVLLLSL
ncbi:NB-ARC - like 10 [Theobroma cacao]|nr:NB-ARC - like 10 [Theobroma cacao]